MRWSDPAALALAGHLAFAVSAAATAWARRHALRRGLLDQPGERRSHAIPTPRGGGVGIALVGLLATAWLAMVASPAWWPVAAGLLLVAAAGWWDDHRDAPPVLRLALHAVAGLLLAISVSVQGGGPWFVTLSFMLAVGLVNAWNFMDGIDGLAASQGALCALALLLVGDAAVGPLALAVAAACLGFLPFNLPRARIFLGDVGSGAIGYLVATLLVFAALPMPPAKWLLLLLPASAFLIDAGMTLVWRVARGERWWTPHVQHLYQRASRRFGHAKVAIVYGLWTIVAIAVMIATISCEGTRVLAAAAGVPVVAGLAWMGLHRRWGGDKEGFGA